MLKFYVFSLIAGSVNGLLGQGGGMVILPVLYKYLKDEKEAHRAVILFVLPLAIISSAIYKKTVDVTITIPICLGACVGGIIGFFISKKLSVKALKMIFGIVIVYLGIRQLC